MAITLEHDRYTVRRKVLRVVGAAFHVFDPNEQLVFYSQLKAFKAKEDIRLYTGEDMETELLQILARQVIDMKGRVSEHAEQLARRLSERLAAPDPNRIEVFRLESEIIEVFKRLYYFAKRIAKIVDTRIDQGETDEWEREAA